MRCAARSADVVGGGGRPVLGPCRRGAWRSSCSFATSSTYGTAEQSCSCGAQTRWGRASSAVGRHHCCLQHSPCSWHVARREPQPSPQLGQAAQCRQHRAIWRCPAARPPPRRCPMPKQASGVQQKRRLGFLVSPPPPPPPLSGGPAAVSQRLPRRVAACSTPAAVACHLQRHGSLPPSCTCTRWRCAGVGGWRCCITPARTPVHAWREHRSWRSPHPAGVPPSVTRCVVQRLSDVLPGESGALPCVPCPALQPVLPHAGVPRLPRAPHSPEWQCRVLLGPCRTLKMRLRPSSHG